MPIVSHEFKRVPLAKIRVENRFRKEMGDLEELAQAIKSKGQLAPLIINQSLRLLAGERRFRALQQLKEKDAWCAIIRTKGEVDELEIEIMENVLRKDFTWHERAEAEAELNRFYTKKDPKWTQQKQAQLLDVSVGAVNRRLQLAATFEQIPELKTCETQDEAWRVMKRIEERLAIEALHKQVQEQGNKKPEKGVPVHQWAIDHYKIGDALDEKLGLARIHDGIAHFAEVDPPYGIDLNDRKVRGNKSMSRSNDYEEVDAADYGTFIANVAEQVFRILYKDSFSIWWFGIEWYATILAALQEVGFKVSVIPGIWFKGNTGQTASPDTMLGNSYETFFIARKGQPKLVRPGRSNVFEYSPIPPAQKIHKTEKPIELMLDIINTFCYPGSRIISPFLGSGVTLRAAYRKGMVGFGWDLSEKHKYSFLNKVKEDILMGVEPEKQKAVGEE